MKFVTLHEQLEPEKFVTTENSPVFESPPQLPRRFENLISQLALDFLCEKMKIFGGWPNFREGFSNQDSKE